MFFNLKNSCSCEILGLGRDKRLAGWLGLIKPWKFCQVLIETRLEIRAGSACARGEGRRVWRRLCQKKNSEQTNDSKASYEITVLETYIALLVGQVDVFVLFAGQK